MEQNKDEQSDSNQEPTGNQQYTSSGASMAAQEPNIHDIDVDTIRKYSDLFKEDGPLCILVTKGLDGNNTFYMEEELNEVKSLSIQTFKHARTLSFVTIGLLVLIIGYELKFAPKYSKIEEWLPHTFPKIVLVIIVQIFAFFYFSITKTSLNRVQYLINEKTNIHLKIYALKASVALNQSKIVSEILSEFAKTERNFIIEKDKTTVEIEKSRHEMESFKSSSGILDQLSNFIDKLKLK